MVSEVRSGDRRARAPSSSTAAVLRGRSGVAAGWCSPPGGTASCRGRSRRGAADLAAARAEPTTSSGELADGLTAAPDDVEAARRSSASRKRSRTTSTAWRRRPRASGELVTPGHRVIVETTAGDGSAIADDHYVRGRPDRARRGRGVRRGRADRQGQGAAAGGVRTVPRRPRALHLPAPRRRREADAVPRRTRGPRRRVRDGPDADGRLPLLAPMSEIAGRMAPQEGRSISSGRSGGRGVADGRCLRRDAREGRSCSAAAWPAGTPPQIAAGMEAEVVVLDKDVDRLREIDRIWHGRIQTVTSSRLAIERLVTGRRPGRSGPCWFPARARRICVSAELVQADASGRRRSSTSRSTRAGASRRRTSRRTPTRPTSSTTWSHYAVGNMPGAVPRTSDVRARRT